TLQVSHGGSPVRYSGLYLTLGDGVTDANEHENNYYPGTDKNQSHLTIIYANALYGVGCAAQAPGGGVPSAARALRSMAGSIPAASRYFATVRRAITTPCSARRSAIWLSDRGFLLDSSPTSLMIN